MSDYSYVFNAHPSFIEDMYQKYQSDPDAVDQNWRTFFEGFEFGSNGNGSVQNAISSDNTVKEFGVLSIIHGFRSRGHLLSTTNPIRTRRDRAPHLDLPDYNLSKADLHTVFIAGEEIGLKDATLGQIIDHLRLIYTSDLGIEYAHIENREKRMWLRNKIEGRDMANDFGLSKEKKQRILEKLNGAVMFEKFLHTKYVGQKRFSLEGGETTIAAIDAIINSAAEDKVEEVILGMAHRGRLNVLANIMGKTYENIFSEFEGTSVPDLSFGDGDVKYHLGFSSQVKSATGKLVHLKLAPNPSHLEAVNTVVQGFARAKADLLYGSDYDKILPILIHGDAAVVGQGVSYETVQMSQLKGYYTGGTIHYIINNQIGFTTDFDDPRSSTYCTAAASLVQAPVFHVNGDNPDAVIFASELATEYRQLFNNDVFIDMVCYRRHGHNEGDDPKFTQPQMYELIHDHKNPREVYADKLMHSNEVDQGIAETLEKSFWATLQDRLDLVKEKKLPYEYQEPEQAWRTLIKKTNGSDYEISPKTGIAKKKLDLLINHLMTVPKDFNLLSKINRLQKGKQKLLDSNKLDWALAELLAYGSILLEGKNVRMSGQDVKRGTFSHRHAIFNDAKTFKDYNRLSGMTEKQGQFMIYNSLLSEFGVLGFEYGYSLATPDNLIIWEAQFGDFANGAQTIFDQFISAGESKWRRMSGLILLLPHGYEGQGPEHSSARLERQLQACAEYNLTVANVTTPANFFHIIRRQLARKFRKPLIIMSPKSLLRHSKCVSDKTEFTTGKVFQEVIADHENSSKVKKVLLCSGKIYYDLLERKENDNRSDVVLVRLEQLYPFPVEQIKTVFDMYDKASFTWVQEEPKNMGAWTFILNELRSTNIELISRKASASPATGFKKVHDEEQLGIVDKAFA